MCSRKKEKIWDPTARTGCTACYPGTHFSSNLRRNITQLEQTWLSRHNLFGHPVFLPQTCCVVRGCRVLGQSIGWNRCTFACLRIAHVQKHSRTGRRRMTTVHLLRSQPSPINVSQSHFPARASSRSQKQKDCTRATQEPRMQRPTHSALLILRRDTAHVALPGWCKEGLRHPKLRALRN
jgi:hypothetical protein